MNSSNQGVRFTDDYRRRYDLLAVEPVELPDTRKGERFKILATKAVWLFPIMVLLPLIEASGWDEAATFCKRLTE